MAVLIYPLLHGCCFRWLWSLLMASVIISSIVVLLSVSLCYRSYDCHTDTLVCYLYLENSFIYALHIFICHSYESFFVGWLFIPEVSAPLYTGNPVYARLDCFKEIICFLIPLLLQTWGNFRDSVLRRSLIAKDRKASQRSWSLHYMCLDVCSALCGPVFFKNMCCVIQVEWVRKQKTSIWCKPHQMQDACVQPLTKWAFVKSIQLYLSRAFNNQNCV